MCRLRSICVVAALLGLLGFVAGCNQVLPVFNVNEVASDPGAFSGSLAVVGVTYAYSKESPDIIGIMDKKELQCTTPSCSKTLLPVKIIGERPAVGDEVKVSGIMVKESWGYLFQAEAVHVVTRHKLGGN